MRPTQTQSFRGGINSYCGLTAEESTTHPSSARCLWVKARRSAALPVPSHTTTGSLSLTVSHTARMALGPPSTTSPTTGTPCLEPVSENKQYQSVTEKPYAGQASILLSWTQVFQSPQIPATRAPPLPSLTHSGFPSLRPSQKLALSIKLQK